LASRDRAADAAPSREAIIAEILAKVHARAPKTACPSEVARALAEDEAAWRALMPAVREAAAQLAETSRIRVTQKGREVDVRSARGPVRLAAPAGR